MKVGLFPGAGGTQRLPRMMQTQDALQMLLKGEQLSSTKAKALKIVDQSSGGRSGQDREGLDQGWRQGDGAVG